MSGIAAPPDPARALDGLCDAAAQPRQIAVATPETWRQQLDAAGLAWAERSGFRGRPGDTLILPAADGNDGDNAAGQPDVLFLPDESDGHWSWSGLAAALPAGDYRLRPGDRKSGDHESGDHKSGDYDPDAAALGWALHGYRFDRYKQAAAEPLPRLVWPAGADRVVTAATARAIYLIRDMVNTPAGEMDPAGLEQAARRVAGQHGATISTVTGDDLLQAGYPAIHAVGRAAAVPPRLIDMHWGPPDAPKIAIAGKGVCFDSGGLNLKSTPNMRLMKKDMGGAAHALALAAMIMETGLGVRLRLLIPAVENAVSGNALRPLDIIPTRAGRTVEVGNTDAEGRLILADCLAEASGDRPDLLLDFATLTGAARVALGPEIPALFTNDEPLAARFAASAAALGDPLWRLPLYQPYRKLLDSKLADISSTGTDRWGGAITAALFLQGFVGAGIPWAHLDIMAYNSKAKPGRPEGGAAMGLRTAFHTIVAHLNRARPDQTRLDQTRLDQDRPGTGSPGSG